MSFKPEYLADATVDVALDEKIRALLTTCFVGPNNEVFKDRRYYKEPYPHRWVIKNQQGAFIAHVGVHDKIVQADGKTYRIAGICEVCVHPDHRGHGYVKAMLECIHKWLVPQGFDFSVLFGDSKVYGSSGYVNITNLYQDVIGEDGQKHRKQLLPMVKALTAKSWPTTEVFLPGLTF